MKLDEESRKMLIGAIGEKVAASSLTYSELSEKSQVHESQVSRICRGKFRTLSHNVMKVCRELGVALPGESLSSVETPEQRLLEARLAELWDKTPEDARRLAKLLSDLVVLRQSGRRMTDGP